MARYTGARVNAIPDNTQGRVDYLRLSITDRCNLRCTYCMPAEGVPARSHDDILSYEELSAFARVAAGCGISKVRITGGEPLVRHGCADFVGMLGRTSGIHDISLTTNGVLLPRYAADLRRAGLRRVNISLDSLDAERFARISRGGRLADALAGLDAAFDAGFSPVKVNALLLDGVEDELDAFVALTRERQVHVRFIEFMPLDRRLGGDGRLVPAPDILQRLKERYELVPHEGPYGHGPAQYWHAPGALGTIGFIAGVSEHFCESCNRLRLTADGRLRTCLFSGDEVAIRPLIARPAELRDAICAAVSGKSFDRCREQRANERAMSEIGG
jgi:cyclic pyranopterin phosphate synthase